MPMMSNKWGRKLTEVHTSNGTVYSCLFMSAVTQGD